LSDNTILTGWVPGKDLPVFYNLADLFVFPSLYEGFGIPLLEAMASGCPVITSDRGATREIAGEAAMLVEPENREELADMVQRVLADGRLRQDLIERGLKRANEFSWERCARETLSVFESVASSRPGS
jgi:glycosyltransferase involved in cell wall biosynthesis